MLVCFAARMSKEESRSVLLEKYVTKRLRKCLCGLLYYPGKIIIGQKYEIKTSTAKVILNNNLKFFLSATFKYNISGNMIKEKKKKKTRFFFIFIKNLCKTYIKNFS